uniref:VWFD domain-containing protein n=1 Tax=Mastacembelus armatus TaxID=205130 RepID=A0A3Q3L882_9TELE
MYIHICRLLKILLCILQDGESWKENNCTKGTCSAGKVITEHVPCEPVTIPICENQQPPVRVYDEAGCCFHYECKCVCSGWGDPHYVTFDGEYYSFQKNCTYVLVKEIQPKYNFRVIIDNENCDPSGTVTCAKALIVYYKNYKIILTQKRNPKTVNLVYVDDKQVFPTYSNKDFIVTSTAIELLLKIPEIEAVVMFKGLLFSIDLPFSRFHGNTEGQCGTCDNNRKNDCRLPNGDIDPSCSDMANHWRVPDKNKPYCEVPPSPTPIPTRTPTPEPCKPNICEILISKVFEKCHSVVPPTHFYEACKFDVCHMPNSTVGCSSLEAYAMMCAEAFVCVPWRSATHGQCDYKCPANKVYKPCGPTVVPTCNARYNEKYTQQCQAENANQDTGCLVTEGCFCPEGLTLFSSNSDICVSSCCTGPDGQPKKYGETWQSGCQQCSCDEATLSVQCKPVTCATQEPVTCTEEGEVLVTRTVDCCEKQICVFKFYCLQPGMEFSKSPCEICHCTDTQDPNSKLNEITCVIGDCFEECSEGYVYEEQPGQCCGTCKKISCVMEFPDSPPIIIESWSPPDDKCVMYECQKGSCGASSSM